MTVGYIAGWDGEAWSGLGSGVDINGVYALTVYRDELIAGGQFSAAGDTPASCVASWDGSVWSALGEGVGEGGMVTALRVYGDSLAVGGIFTSAGGVTATNVAWWGGSSSTWGAFDSGTYEGVNDIVYALVEFNDTLVVGGAFHDSDDDSDPRQRIVRWDGSQWVGICNGLDNDVEALEVLYGMLFVGGEYDGVFCDGERVNFGCPAYWDGSDWHGFGLGIDGQTFALAWFGDKLVVGTGSPAMAGDALVHGVAQWDGETWSPMGRLDGFVHAFAVHNGELYAGGNFPLSGSSGPRNIARWDGPTSAWVSLDAANEPANEVFALGVWDTVLVAGGRFTNIGNYIARWNGHAWSAFGSGLGQEVYALAAYKGDLIAGGLFTPHVAKWKAGEEVNWEYLGVGTNHVAKPWPSGATCWWRADAPLKPVGSPRTTSRPGTIRRGLPWTAACPGPRTPGWRRSGCSTAPSWPAAASRRPAPRMPSTWRGSTAPPGSRSDPGSRIIPARRS